MIEIQSKAQFKPTAARLSAEPQSIHRLCKESRMILREECDKSYLAAVENLSSNPRERDGEFFR